MMGVSVVIPVKNGARWIGDVIDAIVADAGERPLEIIAIDDGSADTSGDLLEALASRRDVRVLVGPKRGAAAAINLGVLAARFPLVAQVDQDVVIQRGWFDRLIASFQNGSVAAAQGHYVSPPGASFFARVNALDLGERYHAIPAGDTDHACTGNSIYRASALRAVGLFDERLGYGYDNDMSYRLQDAGFRLMFCPHATSVHHWRSGFAAYVRQQYGLGYGRLELVRKHPRRYRGDRVSPAAMMLHPALALVALVAATAAFVDLIAGGPPLLARICAIVALALFAALGSERLIAGVRALCRYRTLVPLAFPVVHLARDAVWVSAIAVWSVRFVSGAGSGPEHSMPVRRDRRTAPPTAPRPVVRRPTRVVCVIPAHNEVAALPDVLADVRTHCPDLDLIVVDDGSHDDTVKVADAYGARWLQFPERMGVGSAMRAGLRYAARLGYDGAVRLDGDGQHRASDIARVLAPLQTGEADVVLGSRYATQAHKSRGTVRLVQRLLGWCLSTLVGHAVTDPTSGFCALGPRAVTLLAEHHPTGYPEPELRLFLERNNLTVVEIPIDSRPRRGGKTSLTLPRVTAAGARVLLAMLIVPLRHAVGRDRD